MKMNIPVLRHQLPGGLAGEGERLEHEVDLLVGGEPGEVEPREARPQDLVGGVLRLSPAEVRPVGPSINDVHEFLGISDPPSSAFHATYQYCPSAKLGNS